jgi:hypothetical protein
MVAESSYEKPSMQDINGMLATNFSSCTKLFSINLFMYSHSLIEHTATITEKLFKGRYDFFKSKLKKVILRTHLLFLL